MLHTVYIPEFGSIFHLSFRQVTWMVVMVLGLFFFDGIYLFFLLRITHVVTTFSGRRSQRPK